MNEFEISKKVIDNLSILKDPFQKDKIDAIHIHCYKSRIFGEWIISAQVEFKNDNTRGIQTFEGDTLENLLKQIQKFINSL